jgi:putative spermidine/putrescine transport system permease protein
MSTPSADRVPERTPGRLGELSARFGRRLVTGLIYLTVVFLIGPVLVTVVASFAYDWTGILPVFVREWTVLVSTGVVDIAAPADFGTLANWKQALGIADSQGAQRGLGGTWDVVVPRLGLTIPIPTALGFSVLLALGGVFINLLVGIPVAYAVTRYEFYGRGWLNTFAVLPIVPGIILGIAFIKTYPNAPSAVALMIGYSLLKVPYMVLAVQSSFESMGLRQMEESARSLGASWPRSVLTVVVPNAKRGIVSGAIICWTLAAAEFNFSYMVYSKGPRPFSLFLFENISNNPFLRAAAAISIYFVIVAAVTALLQRVGESGFSIGSVR